MRLRGGVGGRGGEGGVAMPPPRILPPANRRDNRLRLLVAILAARALVNLDVRDLDLHLDTREGLTAETKRSVTAARAARVPPRAVVWRAVVAQRGVVASVLV